MRKKLKLTGFEMLRKRRSDRNTDYFGLVETEETSMVDLCLCFLSLRRMESGEGEAKRREGTSCGCFGTGAALAEAGEGRGRGGRQVALSSERRDCLKIEIEMFRFRISGE
jgi:hypothetical protein